MENPNETIADPKLKRLQRSLRENIKEDCEIIRQAWHDYLPVTDLALTYQNLKMIETNAGRTFEINIESENYSYLKHETIRIFLIEGDPGIGKSTYVNKLAMDWSNLHQLLNETFDFVIKMSWLDFNVEKNWKESIVSEFGNEMNADSLQNLLKLKTTLIILDGYDENPMEKVLQEITAKYDPMTGDRMWMRLLITTRGSHVEEFKILKNKIWLRILGFDEKSAISFIKTQLNHAQNTEEILAAHGSIFEIVKNPLYAAMIAATELTLKLLKMEPQMRIKEIFDAFLKFQKDRYFDTYPDADEDQYNQMVEQLGKYALNFLYCEHKEEFLANLGVKFETFPRPKYEEWLKMGLVQSFKQQRPNERIEKISFLHQTLAEYHAANYVAKRAIFRGHVAIFHDTPVLFRSFVFGLWKDLFVAAVDVAHAQPILA